MYNATSYHHSYEDTGLLCIHASADPKQVFKDKCPSKVITSLLTRQNKRCSNLLPIMFFLGSRDGGNHHKRIHSNGRSSRGGE